jgi:hypothetical protein
MIKLAAVRLLNAADHLEQGALAAPALAYYAEYLALVQLKIHMLKRPDSAVTVYIFFIQIFP